MPKPYKFIKDLGKIETAQPVLPFEPIKLETVQPVSPFEPMKLETGSISGPILGYDVIDYTNSYSNVEVINRLHLNQLKYRITQELLRIILEQDFEYGCDSPADLFVRRLMEQNSAVVKEWLNSIFIEYFHDTRILIGLLHIISHIDYLKINPQGPTIALAALSHIDPEVRECGIRAFENWGTADSLNILRNIKCQEKWLQEYLNQVILDLEEELEDNVSSY